MAMTNCWCGSEQIHVFGQEYGVCVTCGTLVYTKAIPPETLVVLNDETDYYGKKYWLEHQEEDFGYDDLYTRTRNDLTERNLHWLKTLLKYQLPPAKVLEVGCAHGSFVALLRQAGYNAAGVEMSPWIVEFGKKTFDVPILLGPIEALDIPSGSLDVIFLMDVLEHLPDPLTTMAHCLQLLKPDGLLLIQTPQFKTEMNYAELVETKGVFLEQLKAVEHLYLFSESSATQLFQQLGAEHIQFETAIFDYYDMFFVVSRESIVRVPPGQVESVLLSTSKGRFSLALLDMDTKAEALNKTIDELQNFKDSAISQVNTLTGWVEEARSETVLLKEWQSSAQQQIETLTEWVVLLEDRLVTALQKNEILAGIVPSIIVKFAHTISTIYEDLIKKIWR